VLPQFGQKDSSITELSSDTIASSFAFTFSHSTCAKRKPHYKTHIREETFQVAVSNKKILTLCTCCSISQTMVRITDGSGVYFA